LIAAAATIAAFGLSGIRAEAQGRAANSNYVSSGNFGSFGASLSPFGFDNSFFQSGQLSGITGFQPGGFDMIGSLLQPFGLPLDYAYGGNTAPLGGSQLYEQGYNGRYNEVAAPGGATDTPAVYGYNYGNGSTPAAQNSNGNNVQNPTGNSGTSQGAATDQNGTPTQQDSNTPANSVVPNSAPTTEGRISISTVPTTTGNPVRLVRRANGRVEIQYRGRTANVNNITISLLDRNRQVVTQSVRTEPPAAATLNKYSGARYYAVTVQYNDGTTRRFVGAVK
jgi:hypothetical protein